MASDIGERLGYVPARDDGAFAEFGHGVVRGLKQAQGGFYNTIGNEAGVEEANLFMRINQDLGDSERKSTLSYVSNVLGAAVGQNAPTFAAMLAAGAVTGGLGAGAVAATRVGQAVGFAGNYLMTYGDNKDELKASMPNASEMDLTAIASILTAGQSWIEVAFGATPAVSRAMARMATGKLLMEGGVLETIKKAVGPMTLGRLSNSWGGEILKTAGGESFEEIVQNLGMDATKGMFGTVQSGESDAEFMKRYKQVIVEGFIGGLGLGLFPATMNSISNQRRNATINNMTKDNPVTQDVVNQQINILDANKVQKVNEFYNFLSEQLGVQSARILKNISYQLTLSEMESAKTDSSTQVRMPDERFSELNLLLLNDKDGVQSRELRGYLESQDMDKVVGFLNKLPSKTGDQIVSLGDGVEMRDISKNLVENKRAFKEQYGVDIDNVPTDLDSKATTAVSEALGTDQTGATLEGKTFVDLVKDINKFRSPNSPDINASVMQRVMDIMGERLGKENLLYLFANGGWIRGLKVGESKIAVRMDIKLNPETRKNEVVGFIYNDDTAGKIIDGEKKLSDDVRALDKAPSETRDVLINTVNLSKLRAENNRIGRLLNRADEFINKPLQEATPLVSPVAEEAAKKAPLEEKPALARADAEVAEKSKVKGAVEDRNLGVELQGIKEDLGGGGALLNNWHLILLLQNHNDQTVLHEFMHYLLENKLMPNASYQAFLDNFGVLGTSPDGSPLKYFDAASKENAANALAKYIKDGGESFKGKTDLLQALRSAQSTISSELIKLVVNAENNKVKIGGNVLTLEPSVSALLKKLVSQVSPDEVTSIYSQAFDASLTDSRPRVGQVDEQRINDMADNIVVGEKNKGNVGVKRDKYLADKIAELDPIAKGKTKVSELNLHEKLILQSKVLDDWRVFNPAAGAEKSQVLMELKPYAQVIAERRALTDVDKIEAEIRSLKIERNSEKDPAKQKQLDIKIAQRDSDVTHIEAGFRQREMVLMEPRVIPPTFEDYLSSIRGETVTKAALRMSDGTIVQGNTHSDAMMNAVAEGLNTEGSERGAVTSKREFVSAYEAGVLSGIEIPSVWQSTDIGKKVDKEQLRKNAKSYYDALYINPDFGKDIMMEGKVEGGPPPVTASLMSKAHAITKGDHVAVTSIAREMYPSIESTTELTPSQWRSVIFTLEDNAGEHEVVKETSPIVQALANEVTKGLVNDVQYPTRDALGFARSLAVRTGRSLANGINNIHTLCYAIANGNMNSSWIKDVSGVISAADDAKWKQWTRVNNEVSTMMNKAGKSFGNMYRWREVIDPATGKGRRMTNSEIAGWYVQSNYGTEFDSELMKDCLSSSQAPSLETVKAAVDIAKQDSNILEFVRLTQAIKNDVAEQAFAVQEKLTGKKMSLLQHAHMRVERNNETISDADPMKGLTGLTYYGNDGKLKNPVPTGLYSRTGGGGDVVNMDYFGLVFKELDANINYINQAPVVANLLEVLSNDAMVKSFNEKYGETSTLESLISLVKRQMSPTGKIRTGMAMGDSLFKKLSSHAAQTFLPYNLFTPATQLTSIPLFLGTISPKHMIKFGANLFSIARQAVWGKGVTGTDAYQFMREISPKLTEIYKTHSLDTVEQVRRSKGADGFFIGTPKWNKFLDFGMLGLQWADMIPRMAGFITAYQTKLDELQDTGMSQAEAKQAAKLFAESAVGGAFNPASKTEKGLFQSESSEATKLMFLFSSQPFAQMRFFINNMWLPTLYAIKNDGLAGGIKKLSDPRMLYKLGMVTLIPGVMLGALARRRPQKDLGEVLFDSFFLGVANMIPVMGQALWFGAVFGVGSGASDFGGVHARMAADVKNVITDIIKDEVDFKTIRGAIRTTDLITRTPSYLSRIALGIGENIYYKGGEFNGKSVAEIMGAKSRD